MGATFNPFTGTIDFTGPGGGSGSGDVTHTGTLTSGKLIQGNGGADITVNATTATVTKLTAGTPSAATAGTDYTDAAFKTISVSGQSDVVADSAADTLTLAAGSNITITTNAGTDTITIAAASGSGTVTTTGSPASGNLTKFSGATSITNGDLSGDATTSGTLAVTLANTAVTPASYTNTNLTVDSKGRITAASNGSAYDYLSVLTSAEISITGATTATISRQHVVTGTSADYTITLPAASGLTGKFLSLRFGPTLTQLSKFITLDGNASEKIDGALTQLCWAGESVMLYTDGSNWFSIARRALPMICELHDDSKTQTMFNTMFTSQTFDASATDNTGAMANLVNSRIQIKRTGLYICRGNFQLTSIAGSAPGSSIYAELYVNSAGINLSSGYNLVATSTFPFITTSTIRLPLTTGDYVELFCGSFTGSDETAVNAQLEVVEIPTW